MENLAGLGIALIVGLCLGYFLAGLMKGKPEEVEEVPEPQTDWWKIRETLTGTQMQILQYMEAKKEASITLLQEKFSFIPDRELYYRLEQICLMDFVARGRKDGEVNYTLNPNYSGTVEGDKTVMMPQA
jgi:hypothetical protein